MRSMHILAAGLAAVVLAVPAIAQDDTSGPEAEPFTGVYVGGSFGASIQGNDIGERVDFDTNNDGTFGDAVLTADGANAFGPGFCNGFSTNRTPAGGCENDNDDIEYYGRVGFDKQFGSFVVGIVGEVGKSEATDSVTAFSGTPHSYTFTRGIDWSAGLRARAGYTPGTTLFYVTGGGAYADLDHEFTSTNGSNSFTASEDSSDAWGWSAGGGVEQKFGENFSVGLEYLYTRYSDEDYRVEVGPGSAPADNPFLLVDPTGTTMRRSDDKFNVQSVRVTGAFRF